jgi:hypothetical protein
MPGDGIEDEGAMPQIDPQASRKPTLIPYDSVYPAERLVSLPAAKETGKWAYPAYGERARRTTTGK